MQVKEAIRQFFNRLGYDITRIREIARDNPGIGTFDEMLTTNGLNMVHYGCGSRMFDKGWINLDLPVEPLVKGGHYLSVNLIACHPFQSNYFSFGFAEDFLEHLDQPQSIVFLSEAYRTLGQGGVLRLSFPGLKGVLNKHFNRSDFEGVSRGQYDAYTKWGHYHFYSEESLATVARHIGFSDIKFVRYGESEHKQLVGRDTRSEQKDLNIYAELTK